MLIKANRKMHPDTCIVICFLTQTVQQFLFKSLSFSKTVSDTIFEVTTAEDQKVSRNQDPLALDVVDTVQRRFPF